MKTKLITMLIIILLFNSCSVDDYELKGSLTDETVITSESTAIAVLNGIYNQSRPTWSGLGEITLALSAAGIEQRFEGPEQNIRAFNTNNVKPGPPTDISSAIYSFYKGGYSSINLINVFVGKLEKGVPRLSEETTKQMLAEAKTLRALSYFNMLRVFGQFYDSASPYGLATTTNEINGFSKLKRASVEDTYKLIIRDLEYAIKYGVDKIIRNGTSGENQDSDNGTPNVYVTKTFSKALLAKVYLSKGGAENYAKTVQLCKSIIGTLGEKFELEDSYEEIFTNKFNSSEVLFAPFSSNKERVRTFFSELYSKPTEVLMNIADEAVADEEEIDPVTGEIITIKKYDPRYAFTFPEGSGTYEKYPDNSSTYYYLRVAEVYLMYAEAEVRRSGGDTQKALDALNKVRKRAYVNEVDPDQYLKEFTDKATLLEDIRVEKLLELHIENAEPWFDIVRYDVLGDLSAKDIKPTIKNKNQLIFPIPGRAIANNPDFGPQNPGY